MKTANEIIRKNLPKGVYLTNALIAIERAMEEYAEERVSYNKQPYPSNKEVEEKINEIVNSYNKSVPVDCAIREGINWILNKLNT